MTTTPPPLAPYFCQKLFLRDNRTFVCWERNGHPGECRTFRQALAQADGHPGEERSDEPTPV